jgi:acyl carrier protein
MEQDRLERLRQLLCDKLAIDNEQLRLDANFVTDLGADSLDIVELAMCLEEEFRIRIPESDYERFVTVSDALAYIEERVGP